MSVVNLTLDLHQYHRIQIQGEDQASKIAFIRSKIYELFDLEKEFQFELYYEESLNYIPQHSNISNDSKVVIALINPFFKITEEEKES
mmetsp:Transcript_43104/g.31484  ORF Transcript_43104/g.31484 Transcript_43104/m.31484 type:complete len:88 (+) Transcript_43104:41-304(+)